MGTLDELHHWADRNHHVDLTDTDTVLSLAANSVVEGAWRNDSMIEGIHGGEDRKSTRLNSSHSQISYAVFCLKKKKKSKKTTIKKKKNKRKKTKKNKKNIKHIIKNRR